MEQDRMQRAKEAVEDVERKMNALQFGIEEYMLGYAKQRSKTTKLTSKLYSISETEGKESKAMLTTIIQAYERKRQLQKTTEDRMEAKTRAPLKVYSNVAKLIKSDMKNLKTAMTEEQKLQQRHKMPEASVVDTKRFINANDAIANADKSVQNANTRLLQDIATCQEKKTHDIKQVLSELLHSEIIYHARSLEILSKAQETIQGQTLK